MDNVAFDNNEVPTLILVKQNPDVVRDSKTEQLVNGGDELKKDAEEYEIVIEAKDGQKKSLFWKRWTWKRNQPKSLIPTWERKTFYASRKQFSGKGLVSFRS